MSKKKKQIGTAAAIAGAVAMGAAVLGLAMHSSPARAHCPLDGKACIELSRLEAHSDRTASRWNRAHRYMGSGLSQWVAAPPAGY